MDRFIVKVFIIYIIVITESRKFVIDTYTLKLVLLIKINSEVNLKTVKSGNLLYTIRFAVSISCLYKPDSMFHNVKILTWCIDWSRRHIYIKLKIVKAIPVMNSRRNHCGTETYFLSPHIAKQITQTKCYCTSILIFKNVH